jgi:hypothetical protein
LHKNWHQKSIHFGQIFLKCYKTFKTTHILKYLKDYSQKHCKVNFCKLKLTWKVPFGNKNPTVGDDWLEILVEDWPNKIPSFANGIVIRRPFGSTLKAATRGPKHKDQISRSPR